LPQSNDRIIAHMESQVGAWEVAGDPRAVFLSCYLLMTRNVLEAIEGGEFHDPAWVKGLMERFAAYYFVAVEAYDRSPDAAPAVWQFAHQVSLSPDSLPLQKVLTGVNAHINYDLVLCLADVLAPEWGGLSDDARAARYRDHCHVNAVIGRTIDAVQDQVLEPSMPVMSLVDALFGSLDERLVSRLITNWREEVWQNATRMLCSADPAERDAVASEVEEAALRIGRLIA
jgi:hypothetical protein